MLNQLPLRMDHHAFAVADQEVNRHFIEDILGIPLVATWCERVFRAEVGHEISDAAAQEKNRAILQEVGGSWHIALQVTQPSFDEIAAMRRKDAHSELKRWLAGDRRTNNDDRPH